jgi:hypothetical protein
MILGNHSRVGRPEHSLTHTSRDTTQKNHQDDRIGESCKHRSRREQRHTEDDDLSPRKAVSKISRKRNCTGKEKIEASGYKSHRTVTYPKKLLNMRQDRIEHLTVTLIKEICDPKQDYYFPFIESGICIYLHMIIVLSS